MSYSGHYNGWRRAVLHSDLSDSNIWMRVESASSAHAVPDWPDENDPKCYPRRPGVLGDWGLGQDVSPTPAAGSNSEGFITVSPLALSCLQNH